MLAELNRRRDLDPLALDAGHYPPGFDHCRVEWECAAWANAGRPPAEAAARLTLLRWRLHLLLAELTADRGRGMRPRPAGGRFVSRLATAALAPT